jgi:hypothetical protein
MGKMNQIGALRLHLGYHLERLIETQMRRMRALPEGVEYEDLGPPKGIHRLIRNMLRVREIGQWTNAETMDKPASMGCRDRGNRFTKKRERTIELMKLQIWFPAVKRELIHKGVAKPVPEMAGGFRTRIDRQMYLVNFVEAPEIIKPAQVIGMRMREEDRINPTQPDIDCLKPQLGRGIDQDIAPIAVDDRRRSAPAIAGIV